MFKKNPVEKQMNILDPYHRFPKYIQEALHNSWSEYFFKHIFSKINEERFKVLFSENYSCPNTPVNILVGLLILKELSHWTDEDMMGALYFDYRAQYALGITDFEKERLCINTVGNFRSRLYEYAKKQGRDLLGEEVDALTKELIEISEMDTSLARQDSFMISANCKVMGRLELIYMVNLNMIKAMGKEDSSLIPESCSHYLEQKDKSKQIHRIQKEEIESKTEQLLKESLALHGAVPQTLQETQAFLNLTRLIEEQTEKSGKKNVPRDKGKISPKSLQNPSESDATYRKKGNKEDIGYVMDIIEAWDKEKKMGMLIHHDLQPNVVSDVELGKRALDNELKGTKAIANDGAFYSPELVKKRLDIEFSFSALNGRKAPKDKLGADRFTIDSDTKMIVRCPGGAKPFWAEYNEKKEIYTARFANEDCASCDLLGTCIFKERKKFNLVSFTEKKLIADTYRSLLGTERHKELGDFRAGVEGVPSVLRRVYRIDHLPVRGLIRA
ncbi:MAG: transposase [Dethiobacteria bacterium]